MFAVHIHGEDHRSVAVRSMARIVFLRPPWQHWGASLFGWTDSCVPRVTCSAVRAYTVSQAYSVVERFSAALNDQHCFSQGFLSLSLRTLSSVLNGVAATVRELKIQ